MPLEQRYLLTPLLVLELVVLSLAVLSLAVLSLAVLSAPAISTSPVSPVVPETRSAPRPHTVEVPQQCPVSLGYARVAVARAPSLYRFADQNADGAVGVRFTGSRMPAAVLIAGRGHDSGDANPCPAHFVVATPEHVPLSDLAGDVGWVDRQGTDYACLWEVPGRFGVVVIDNALDD
jgi:hypothetical protein